MFKKMISWMLLCIALLSITSIAVADTSRYCSLCNERTMFRDGCYGVRKYATESKHHAVGVQDCNYYDEHFKTKQTCTQCGNVYDPSLSHLHLQFHSICNPVFKCPF